MQSIAPDLVTEIQRRLPRLSEGQARIARFVLERPDEAKAISLSDLCRRCRTSEPVVFAFCGVLGLEGFRAFKTALAESLGARKRAPASEAEIADVDLRTERDPALFLKRLGAFYRASLEETLSSLNPAAFERAVDLLNSARRVAIIGVGVSGNVGFVALQNFIRAGTPVTWTNDPNVNFTHLAPLEPGDVCLALSQTGNQRDTIEGAAFARRRGLKVIAVTSDPRSPFAELADVLLLTAPSGVPTTTHLSIGAQLALPILLVTDALAVAFGARRQEALEERARATHAAMKARTIQV